jgi:tetratricopeptide (TPR) repeat protein
VAGDSDDDTTRTVYRAEDDARQVNMRDNHGIVDMSTHHHEAPRQSPRPVASRALPRDPDTLVGRDDALRRILTAAGSGRVVSIHAIDGMPGVGKTALAIRAAHLLAPRFPDGQYFVQLHAHTPGQPVADPSEVLAGLLTDLGIDPHSLPDGLQARRDLWRDRLSDKRVLLVLDDVHGAAQIEPLLPTGAGCLTVVTSRRRLIALDGATPLPLGVLDPEPAVRLFATLSGRDIAEDADRGAADRSAAERIVQRCGYLPLAIVLLAGRLAHHDSWRIADLAESFAASTDRLAELDTPDRAVRAAFDLSYRDLPARQRVMFRLLGLHPGTELEPWAAAALAGIPLETARRYLEALYTDHLLDETSPGRYRLHDLLREYARTLARADSPDDGTRAVARLLDYYLVAAYAAEGFVKAAGRHDNSVPEYQPADIPAFADEGPARKWLHAELGNMVLCARHAVDSHQAPRVLAFSELLGPHLRDVGQLDRAAALYRNAIEVALAHGSLSRAGHAMSGLGEILQRQTDYAAARELYARAQSLYRRADHKAGEAMALRGLGLIDYLVDDLDLARTHFEEGYALFVDIGDQVGQAQTLHGLATVRYLADEYDAALADMERVLDIYLGLHDRAGEADTLWGIGKIKHLAGRNSAAHRDFSDCLTIFRQLGNRPGEASGVWGLAVVALHTGQLDQAGVYFEESRRLYDDICDQLGVANTLVGSGKVEQQKGDHGRALVCLRQALEMYRATNIPRGEADALAAMGTSLRLSLRVDEAVAALSGAVELYRQIGMAKSAEEVTVELRELLAANG